MSVSNYKPNQCLYRIDQLDDVVYLFPENALRNIKIDNGEAYVENIVYEPLILHCYNISLEDTETLDERYEFSHTLKFNTVGYANHNDFDGRYYVVVKTVADEYWLLNPLFPCKVTYSYTLGYNDSHTEFTLSTISNHPTLRVRGMNMLRPYPCNGYVLDGFKQLLLNERRYSARYGNYVRYTNSGFSEVVFDKKSPIFKEDFDGTNVSHTVQFDIKFDDYKDSWHYNLLEFTDNLYSAVIKTNNGDYVLCGFGFGLQPSFTVSADGEASVPNHIEIVLQDAHNVGSLATIIRGGTISPIESGETYVYTSEHNGWECVGDGEAKYLLMAELDAFSNPTGRYKCLEGYEEQFQDLNIIGTFDEVVLFNQPLCKEQECSLYTSLTDKVDVYAQQCTTFTVKADSRWRIANTANFLQFSPTSGEANTEYVVNMCNLRGLEDDTISSAFTIQYCDTEKTYMVNIYKRTDCFYNGYEKTISAEGQWVIFPTQCCVKEVSENGGDTITDIQLMGQIMKVWVPENVDEMPRTFILDVTLCNGNVVNVIIHQGNGYYRWVNEGSVCVGSQKCDLQRMYSGLTPTDIDTRTEVTRTINCVASTECGGSETRWVQTTDTMCYNNLKYYIEKEQIKLTPTSEWTDTGLLRRGSETEDSPSECAAIEYEYRWAASSGYLCSGTTKMTREVYQQRISGSSDPWVDVIPLQERAALPIIEAQSTDCGYVPPIEPQYKWVRMDITTDYICDECPTPQYRTLTTATTCIGYDLYTLEEYQVSYDEGTTWTTTATSATTLIEADSENCGYVPPTPPTPTDYSLQYLTLVPVSASTSFMFSNNTINYSLDSGSTWASLAANTATPSVGVGDKIMFKVSGLTPTSYSGIGRFSGSSQFDVEGNIMSLAYGDDFSGQTSLNRKTYQFYNLFSGSSVVSAENLVLPATTLTYGCYRSMFQGCISLTVAPQLPATTLASYCYFYMFQGCSSLTVAPQLPATTLTDSCYDSMFEGCSGLTVAPQLLATTLAQYCYSYMFYGCSSLNTITCLASDISATYCTDSWVDGVSSNGTFYKASGMSSWGSGASGIPYNWTIIDYQE